MNNKKFFYGVVGLILGMVLIWIFAVSAVNGGNMGMMRMMGMGSSSIMPNNIDQHFIEQMIPHHDDAITMANIALQKAEHQEIKTLAQNIVKAQTDENNLMKEWYKDWFGKNVSDVFATSDHGMGSGMMHGGMMGNASDITSLESANPFDKKFIEEMIRHHQMAVMMAEMLQRTTQRQDMKQLAHDIIDAQTAEIEQMRSWYSTWYK